MKRFAFKESAAVAAGLTGAVIVACSQGPEETAPVVPVPSATAAVTTPAGGMSTAPVVAGSMTAAPPAASSAGPLMVTATATVAMADSTPEIPAVVAAWTAGDGVTTIALKQDPATPGKICMEGNAPDSAVGSDMYKNWGAALGLNLRLSDGTPWNAKALEIGGFTFNIEVTSGSRPIRIQMGQIDDPAISKLTFPSTYASGACVTAKDDCNYGKNSFVFGGSSPKDQKATATVTVDLAKVTFPSWTKVPKLDANGMWPTDAAAAGTGAPVATMTPVAAATGTGAGAPIATMTPVGSGTAPAAAGTAPAMPTMAMPAAGGMPVYALATGQVIDLAKLASLQFQVVTAPTLPGPYQFCVSNLKWVKADLTTEVPVAKRMDVAAATSGAMPVSTAPVSTAPMGSSTAPVSTAPMGSSTAPAPSGTAMAGNAALDAAFPIFTTNCTVCHMGAHGISTDKATVQKMTKKDADDIVKAVTTGSSAGNVMPKGKTPLSAGDIDKLKAWAATRM